MFEFGFPVYTLTVLFDVPDTSYYVEVENVHCCVTLCGMENDPWRAWKVMENF